MSLACAPYLSFNPYTVAPDLVLDRLIPKESRLSKIPPSDQKTWKQFPYLLGTPTNCRMGPQLVPGACRTSLRVVTEARKGSVLNWLSSHVVIGSAIGEIAERPCSNGTE